MKQACSLHTTTYFGFCVVWCVLFCVVRLLSASLLVLDTLGAVVDLDRLTFELCRHCVLFQSG
jgi:hypothetical protein